MTREEFDKEFNDRILSPLNHSSNSITNETRSKEYDEALREYNRRGLITVREVMNWSLPSKFQK